MPMNFGGLRQVQMGPQGMQQLIPGFLNSQQQTQPAGVGVQNEFVTQMNSFMTQGNNGGVVQSNPQQ